MVASFSVCAQGLQSVETDKLRLLYFDPTETYLVPRVIQSFHGAIEVHERVFGYESDEKTTMLLVDFADGTHHTVPWRPPGRLLVVDSGVRHSP